MISYGGIWLPDPTAAEAAVAGRIDPKGAFGFYRPPYLGDEDLNPRDNIDWFLDRGVKVGTFFNPWGASRWGYAHVIVDEVTLGRLRTLNSSGGNSGYVSLPLVMDDNVGNSITTSLWMLPAVPLQVIDVNFNLYLLPLVDDRYFWWDRSASIAVDLPETTTTWDDIYEQIGTGIGVTINNDAVNGDYLNPGYGLAKEYQYLPLLLDWVASCVGQRIVRTLDGTIYARNAASAKILMTAQAAQYRALNRKTAGGSLSLGAVASA